MSVDVASEEEVQQNAEKVLHDDKGNNHEEYLVSGLPDRKDQRF